MQAAVSTGYFKKAQKDLCSISIVFVARNVCLRQSVSHAYHKACQQCEHICLQTRNYRLPSSQCNHAPLSDKSYMIFCCCSLSQGTMTQQLQCSWQALLVALSMTKLARRQTKCSCSLLPSQHRQSVSPASSHCCHSQQPQIGLLLQQRPLHQLGKSHQQLQGLLHHLLKPLCWQL